MAAPTFVAEYPTAFDTTTSPKAVMSGVSINTGDVLIGVVVGENAASAPLALTENGAASWVLAQDDSTTDYSCRIMSSYTASSNESITVTATSSGLRLFGCNVVRFSATDGVGASAENQSASGSPTLSITTTQDNSAVVVVCTDWNAGSGTQTFTNDFGGSATALTDFLGNSDNYGVAIAYFPDAGAAGSKTIGMSAPTGQVWSISAIEVKGSASSAPKRLMALGAG